MSFFVGKNTSAADILLDPEMLMRHAPEYYGPSFDAVKDLREADPEGAAWRGQEFRLVASLKNVPIFSAVRLLEPDFLDKKKFYEWLDRGTNKRYCTYDRRRVAAKRGDMVTFMDGKEI